jgi:hypothetical protein
MGTTPIYGFPYPDPSDLVANYPALGQDLAEDIEAVLPTLGGISTAIPTTIANSGGTSSLAGNTVTFTAVNSISLNGVFNSAARDYRIVCSYSASVQGTTNMRYRTAGTDNSNNNYDGRGVDVGALTSVSYGQTTHEISSNGTSINGFTMDVLNPQETQYTTNMWSHIRLTVAAVATYRGVTGTFSATTAFDGFTIYPASGTITGTVAVYAYKK